MPTEALFDAEHAAFMQSGISLSVASCGPTLQPTVSRALGCRVAADRRSVTMLVSRLQAAAVLEDVRGSGAVAAVFSQPSTHRTVQLKGKDATIRPADQSEHAIALAYVGAFVAELSPLGYDGEMIRAVLTVPPDDLVALCFTPCAAFSQTPGPGAGQALKAAA